jgi:hypothetical protein
MPSGSWCARSQTRWHHTSFLRLPVALLMARGGGVVVVVAYITNLLLSCK